MTSPKLPHEPYVPSVGAEAPLARFEAVLKQRRSLRAFAETPAEGATVPAAALCNPPFEQVPIWREGL